MLIAQIDEGFVLQLVIPAVGLVAVGHLVHGALQTLAAGGRADNADIQVQALRRTPAVVLGIGKHRHAGEQQAGVGAVVFDQRSSFDFLRRIDLMAKAVGDVVEVAPRPARQQVGEASGPVLLIRREAPDDFHAVGVMTTLPEAMMSFSTLMERMSAWLTAGAVTDAASRHKHSKNEIA